MNTKAQTKVIVLVVVGLLLMGIVVYAGVGDITKPTDYLTLADTSKISVAYLDTADHSDEQIIIKTHSGQEEALSLFEDEMNIFSPAETMGEIRFNIPAGMEVDGVYRHSINTINYEVPTYNKKERPCEDGVDFKEICYDYIKNGTEIKTKYEDVWTKQNLNFVNLIKGDNYFKYKIKTNRNEGEITISFLSKDGNYIGTLDPSVNSSWIYKANLTINTSMVAGDNLNFPVLITQDNLPNALWNSSSSYHALSTGCDLRFTNDSLGENELAFEIVDFTLDTSAEIWVKVQNVSNLSDTIFWVWYNNSNAECYGATDTYGSDNVWTNYNYVNHMNGTTLDDSTVHNNQIDVFGGSPTYSQVGKIGEAVFMDASGDYLRVATSPDWTVGSGEFTIQHWINDTANLDAGYWAIGDNVGDYTFISSQVAGSFYQSYFGATGQNVGGRLAPLNTWTLITTRRVGNNLVTYKNGASYGTYDITGQSEAGNYLYVGFYYDPVYSAVALYDEFRMINNSALTNDWVLTEYNMMNDIGLFLINGTPQANVEQPPTYSGATHNNTYFSQATSFNLTVNDDISLQDWGQWIFSTNNTGVWVNESSINFTTTPETISTILVLNDTTGNIICYKWYLTDNSSLMSITPMYCLTTTSPADTRIHIWEFENVTGVYEIMHLNRTVNGDIKLWLKGNSYNQNIYPQSTLTYDLGSGESRWNKLWVKNISGENIDAYNFSVSGTTGLTQNNYILKDADLVGLTKTYCWMNFTGGILTASDC